MADVLAPTPEDGFEVATNKPEYRSKLVDLMVAAANSIPEGAPVGTVKQRPDGTFVAVRCGDVSPHPASWVYVRVMPGACEEPYGDDADSWPSYGEITPEPEGCGIGLDGECEGKCRKGDAPIGTIARRPDGGYIAIMNELGWEYFYLDVRKPRLDTDGDHADSWPQIRPDQWPDQSGLDWLPPGEEPLVPRPDPTDHPSREELRAYFHKDLAEHCQADDPDEYHEGDKPRLERLMREPSVFDADEVEELAKWLSIHLGTWPEEEWGRRVKPNYYHDRARELLDFGYRKVSDATAQQERAIRGTVEDALRPDDVELLETDPMEFVRRTQQEPATTHPVSPESTNCVPKPRTPRVVDRLGVDEQGSRWHGAEGAAVYFHSGESWRTNQGNVFAAGYQPNWNAPYTEILEPPPEAEGESSPKSSPRVLPSLDCEEARDGTVWEEPDGWRFWFNGEWRTDNGTRGRDLNLYQPCLLRLSTRSYTEVLPDVG